MAELLLAVAALCTVPNGATEQIAYQIIKAEKEKCQKIMLNCLNTVSEKDAFECIQRNSGVK
jgi:hypothetical protein